jgi:hypothetical protein
MLAIGFALSDAMGRRRQRTTIRFCERVRW